MSLRLPADCDASLLREQLDAIEDTNEIRELTLTNCILADIDDLRPCIACCPQLRTLACLSVPFSPNDIVRLVLGPLEHLARLEFSLVVRDDEVAKELETVKAVMGGGQEHESAPNLRHMYVEVVSEKNFDLLSAMLPLFPNLSHLHVHVLRGDLVDAIKKCTNILHTHEHITLFMITSEVPSRAECEPPPALDMDSCAKVCGNVMQMRPPSSWNCLRLCDLAAAQGQEDVHKVDPVLVVAADRLTTPAEITAAAERNRWEDVQHLCFVLFATRHTSRYPRANSTYDGPLRNFFGRFRNLVELNINLFHSALSLDITEILAATPFQAMRALSIAPCALQHCDALSRLSTICPKLEDLDIRFKCGGRYTRCPWCQHELNLYPHQVTHLQEATQLMRFTLAYVPYVRSYVFLRNLRVAEVRLIQSPCPSNAGYLGLDALLLPNDRLRCLVLADKDLEVGTSFLRTSLQQVKTLRYLVMLSDIVVHPLIGVPYCHEMSLGLPRLEVMHIHYKDLDGSMRRMTWLCRPELPQELLGVGEVEPHVPRGQLLHAKPCVICSTETFIGLVKPHNRGLRTSF